jgi:inosine-uridine nucleoside N-ribohydrolase
MAGTPLARICVDLLTFFAGSYRRVFGFDAPPLHDPVAVARVIDGHAASCSAVRPAHLCSRVRR